MKFYSSLNAIRFLCALVVLIHHMPKPNFEIYKYLMFGPSFVVVFFVISGFCIHLPYLNKPISNINKYYLRRFIRLFIPYFAVVPVGMSVNVDFVKLWLPWSIICEAVYYAIYPALRIIWDKIGWLNILVASYAIGYLTVYLEAPQHVLNTVSYLPVWLLGAFLAELSQKSIIIDINKYIARFVFLIASVSFAYLHYTEVAHLKWTMPILGIPALFLVWAELNKKWPKWLENFGEWSYSVYLVHPAIIVPAVAINYHKEFYNLGWLIIFYSSLFVSWVFYLIFEKPSHKLSRNLGR